MEENIMLTVMYDTYGKLLTKKQQEIFEEYYIYNLSLREIAENKGISYQAVRDSLKNSKEIMQEYEDKLNILENKNKLNKLREFILSNKDDLNSVKNELISKINEISEVD